MILQLRATRWRIKRHRDATGVERTVERREELACGRQHDGHRISHAIALFGKTRRNGERLDAQPSIGQVRGRAAVGMKRDQQAVAMAFRMPIEHLDQSGDRIRWILDFRHVASWLGRGHDRGPGRRGHHDVQQVARCLHLRDRRFSECYAEVALDPDQ